MLQVNSFNIEQDIKDRTETKIIKIIWKGETLMKQSR